MPSTIQIKRSQVTNTPNGLAPGEPAYSEKSKTLFIGLSDGSVLAIGGEGTFALRSYVDDKITSVVGGSPALLDTLKELATALGNDANFAATTAAQIGARLLASANLTDLPDKAAARSALGLGALALLNTAPEPATIDGGTF
jgi:hypothetical protein